MLRPRVVVPVALLAFVAACDKPPPTVAESIPDASSSLAVVSAGSVVYDKDGRIIAQAFTDEEAIAHLEEMAAQDPEFLDTPWEYTTAAGEVRTKTFREILNGLKGMPQVAATQQSRSNLLSPAGFRIVEPETGTIANSGASGSKITVGAFMVVDPSSPPPPHDYIAYQKISVPGVASQDLIFEEQRVNPSFPWTKMGMIQSDSIKQYTATSTHRVNHNIEFELITTNSSGTIHAP